MTYGTVVMTERLSPSMIRVVLGGPGLDDFEPAEPTDQYLNALFVPDGAPYAAPFDVDEARSYGSEHRPRGRRITVRRWDAAERTLTLDIVAHGDVGYAGRWAQHAEPGDTLQFVGPSGSYRPDPAADCCVLVGDESALPAIAASLDMLPDDVRAIARVVVDSPDHEVADVASGDHIDWQWLHRSSAAAPETLLVDAVAAIDWPSGKVDVFVHGEAAETRAVRRLLIAERGVDRETASISPYWRRDHTDEAWREIKAQWLADQAADVPDMRDGSSDRHGESPSVRELVADHLASGPQVVGDTDSFPSHAELTRTLLGAGATATLGTLTHDGTPYTSLVAVSVDGDGVPIICVSELAEHTRNLRRDPRASLLVAADGSDGVDPLALSRATLVGRFVEIDVDVEVLARHRSAHPHADDYIHMADFAWWRLDVTHVRHVGGFGVMGWTSADELAAAEPDPIIPVAGPMIAHLNDDHADALSLICVELLGVANRSVTVTDVDRYGVTMTVETRSGPSVVGRCRFAEAPLTEPSQVRAAMVELVRRARDRMAS